MTRKDRLPDLRAGVPALEPDPVLLDQLTALSRTSARPARRAGGRIAVVTVGAVAIGSVSWLAGAVPGTQSPLEPATRHTPAPSATSSTGAAASGSATPDVPVPTAGASGAGRLPRAIDPSDGTVAGPGASGAASASAQPGRPNPGRGDGGGNGHGKGKAQGHLKPHRVGPTTGAEKSAERSRRGENPGAATSTQKRTREARGAKAEAKTPPPGQTGRGTTVTGQSGIPRNGAGTGP